MRRHGRRDSNHAAIVAALRSAGRRVLDLGSVGGGCPDLLIGMPGENLLMEVKSAKGELTPEQEEFYRLWPGPKVIVRTIAEALAATGITTPRAGSLAGASADR